MTAGLLHIHGVWAGTCRPGDSVNAKGHFENIPIRSMLISMHKRNVQEGRLAEKIPGFKDRVHAAIRNDGYKEGPWMWKGSALYHPAWFEFNPVFVTCFRPREHIFRSCRRSGMFGNHLSDDALYANIDLHQNEMRKLQGFPVYTDEVVNGDYSSLKRAIEGAGLQFDEEKTRQFVDRRLWHYGT